MSFPSWVSPLQLALFTSVWANSPVEEEVNPFESLVLQVSGPTQTISGCIIHPNTTRNLPIIPLSSHPPLHSLLMLLCSVIPTYTWTTQMCSLCVSPSLTITYHSILLHQGHWSYDPPLSSSHSPASPGCLLQANWFPITPHCWSHLPPKSPDCVIHPLCTLIHTPALPS